MKNKVLVLILLTVVMVSSCSTENQKSNGEEIFNLIQSEISETNEKKTEAEDESGKNVYKEENENQEVHIEPYSIDEKFDYECYVQGIYTPTEGANGLIFIKPIEFVTESESEEIEKYDIDFENGEYYQVVELEEDVVALPITTETEFLIVNWEHDPELVEHSVRGDEQGLDALQDAGYFISYMQKSYGEKLSTYPLFIQMNEDGTVKSVVELMLI